MKLFWPLKRSHFWFALNSAAWVRIRLQSHRSIFSTFHSDSIIHFFSISLSHSLSLSLSLFCFSVRSIRQNCQNLEQTKNWAHMKKTSYFFSKNKMSQKLWSRRNCGAQGCQMIYFQAKNTIWVNFEGLRNRKCWLVFLVIWKILWPFGIFYGQSVIKW
jgi:hypothetical protein